MDQDKKHAGSKTTDTVYKIYLNSPEMHRMGNRDEQEDVLRCLINQMTEDIQEENRKKEKRFGFLGMAYKSALKLYRG